YLPQKRTTAGPELPQRINPPKCERFGVEIAPTNRIERARTQNRTPLLLVALRTNRVESISFGSRPVRVQTVNANMAVKNSTDYRREADLLNDSASSRAGT